MDIGARSWIHFKRQQQEEPKLMLAMLLKVRWLSFCSEPRKLIDNSADFVTIYVGVNRFLLNTNITIDQFMHYVNQVGLSCSSRYVKCDFCTILVNFDQLKAFKSFWVMQNPEISLNILMNEQRISKNCKSAHRTMIYVTKVIWSWAQPGVISLTGSRLTI